MSIKLRLQIVDQLQNRGSCDIDCLDKFTQRGARSRFVTGNCCVDTWDSGLYLKNMA